jgi:hypothetical protein
VEIFELILVDISFKNKGGDAGVRVLSKGDSKSSASTIG